MYSSIKPWLFLGILCLLMVFAPILIGTFFILILLLMFFGDFVPYNPLREKVTEQWSERREYHSKKRDYLSSPEWKSKRLKVLERDGHKCRACGYKYRLEVHHITYRNLEQEPLNELLTVCRRCHQKIHDKYGVKRTGLFPLVK